MEFSFTQAPMCHHLHSVYRGDDPDNPAPSCRLLRPCSTLRNLSPRSAAPSNACEDSGTLAADDEMSGLSVSSPTDLTYALVGSILYMYVNMVLAHYTFQNMNILTVAYLNQLFTAAFLDITLQHFIAVLRRPHQVTCQTAYRMSIMTIVCHATKIIIFIET